MARQSVRPQRFYEVLIQAISLISIAPKSSGNPRGSRHRSASLRSIESGKRPLTINRSSHRVNKPYGTEVRGHLDIVIFVDPDVHSLDATGLSLSGRTSCVQNGWS
jgi:hypothetical protein